VAQIRPSSAVRV